MTGIILRYFLFGVICCCGLCGCSSNVSERDGEYGIIDLEDALDNNSECINLSKYAVSIEYFPLELNDKSQIGKYPKIKVNDKYIFCEYLNSHKVLIFNNENGEYIKKLDRRGRAKGEYLSCNPFAVVDENNDIIVLSINKILRYDFKDSCILEIPKKNIGSGNMIISNPGDESSFFFNETRWEYIPGSDTERVLNEYSTLIDFSGAVSRKFVGTRKSPYDGRTVFFNYNNQLKVIGSSRDTIYNVNHRNELSVAYITSLGKYSDFKELEIGLDAYDLVVNQGIYETEHFIFFKGELPEKQLLQIFLEGCNEEQLSAILYDKKEKKTYALKRLPKYDYIGFVNDLDNGAPFMPSYTYGNKMYQFMDADTFIEFAEQCDAPAMKRVASQLTEESNPVMIVVTLK